MEIVEIAKDRLKVVLDSDELREFAIDLAGMEYDNEQTERMLEGVLAVVGAKTDFASKKGKTYVQLYPSRDGGCELFLVHIPSDDKENSRALVPFREDGGYLCCFEDKDGALLFEKLLKGYGLQRSSVFYDAEGDRYFFHAHQEGESTFLLEEFGRPADRLTHRYLCEHFEKPERL